MSEHARLSPSSHQWVHCPGYIREKENYLELDSGPAAIDGTGTHLLLELCLNSFVPKLTCQSYLGKTIGVDHPDKKLGWNVKQDRIDRVKQCLKYIDKKISTLRERGLSVKIESESRSNPGKIYGRDDWWGTVDVTITGTKDGVVEYLEIVDLKDGTFYVNHENNPQLIAYAGGKITDFTIDTHIKMTIIQPKILDNPIRCHLATSTMVKIQLDKLAKAAKLTDDPNALLVPDERNGKGYCRWCVHSPNCKALNERVKKKFDENSENLFEILGKLSLDSSTVTSEELSKVLDMESDTVAAFKKAKELADDRLGSGEHIPGYALLPGRSKKEWALPKEKLIQRLRNLKFKKDDIYMSKLITPAQALKKEDITEEQRVKIEKLTEIVPGDKIVKAIGQNDVREMFEGINLI